MVEFGEEIMFLRAKSVGKDKFDSRWEKGIWLGIREESGENIIGTKDGVLKARSIKRHAEHVIDGKVNYLMHFVECHGNQYQGVKVIKLQLEQAFLRHVLFINQRN